MRAVCSSGIGTRRGIRAGLPGVRTASAGDSRRDADVDTAPTDESHTPIRTAQAGAIPIPFDLIAPRGMPVPSEIVPPLSIYPRRELINPYPDRPGCEEEWADALAYCWKPKERKQLGKGDNRGSGRTFEKCVLGRVSERCGGNPTA